MAGTHHAKIKLQEEFSKPRKTGSFKMNRKRNVKILPWQHQKPFIIRCSDDTHE
jgi:hypothetical protein